MNEKDRRRSINSGILKESQGNEFNKKIQKKQSKKILRQQSAKNVILINTQIKCSEVKENR